MILFLRDSLLPYAVFKVRSRDSSRFVPLPLSGVGSLVGSSGLEPPTSRLSGARSNQLSYEPTVFASQSVLVSPRSVLAVRNGRAASLTLASLPCSLGLRVASPATGGAPLRPRANLSRALTS